MVRSKRLGELLKHAREEQKVTLFALSEELQIKRQYLQALEADEYALLPGPAYARAYVLAYAQALGLKAEPLLALLRRDYQVEEKSSLVHQVRQQRWLQPARYSLLGAASFFLILLLYVSVQFYQLNKPPFVELTEPREDAVVAAKVLVKGRAEQGAGVTVNAEPVRLSPEGEFETELFFTREGINTIVIQAIDAQGKEQLLQRTVRVQF